MTTNKQAICDALRAFICQRPGFDLRNYATMRDYRIDYRRTLKDRDIALRFLRDVESRDSITAEHMLAECRGGRLTIEQHGDGYRVDWCTGQYWCVEYRAGAARFLASVLWTEKRECELPRAEQHTGQGEDRYRWAGKWLSAGDWLRQSFRREYGASIAKGYFS